jgi:hypothetical protein
VKDHETVRHVHVPRYFGPRSGIRCLHCNSPVEPDQRVTRTAASPSPNLEATSAAVAARGGRCERCGHWTYREAVPPRSGRSAVGGLCRNCCGLGDGRTEVVRFLTPSPILNLAFQKGRR